MGVGSGGGRGVEWRYTSSSTAIVQNCYPKFKLFSVLQVHGLVVGKNLNNREKSSKILQHPSTSEIPTIINWGVSSIFFHTHITGLLF